MSTHLRVSQVTVEVLYAAEPADLRVTQVTAEVLYAAEPADLRVTQVTAEVLYAAEPADLRVTQVTAEVLYAIGSGTSVFVDLTGETIFANPSGNLGCNTQYNNPFGALAFAEHSECLDESEWVTVDLSSDVTVAVTGASITASVGTVTVFAQKLVSSFCNNDWEEWNVLEALKDSTRIVQLLKIKLDSGTIRAHSGVGELRLENLLRYSEDLTDATWWTKTGCSITANQINAPDSLTTGDLITEDGSAGNHFVYQDYTKSDDREYATISWYVESRQRDEIQLRVGDTAGNYVYAFFDISGNTKGTSGTAGSNFDLINSTIEDNGDGWSRCTISFLTTTGTTVRSALYLSSGSETISYTGDSTSGVYAWGAQYSETRGKIGYYKTALTNQQPEIYYGAGEIAQIQGVEVSAEIRPIPIRVVVSAAPSSLVYAALEEEYHQDDVELYTAFLDVNWRIVTTPVMEWKGRLDKIDVNVDQNSAEILVNCESRLATWDKANLTRFTDADQKALYPTDTFFEYLSAMIDLELEWGGRTVSPGGGTTTPRDQDPRDNDYIN